eukprot:TRINITY_DN29386_c0_g1_i2.p1 TRINITY_DN29386_c0_g1~~TRINITY_DN29386_c0_g1_i2.p1  ORF type:complete len:289 (+),score=45.01 TRINITY_DN29386_c0_g1_i2:127-993(+)
MRKNWFLVACLLAILCNLVLFVVRAGVRNFCGLGKSTGPVTSEQQALNKHSFRIVLLAGKADKNHANQKNPNHPLYYKSRGAAPPAAELRERKAKKMAASKKQAGNFQKHANSLKSKDKVSNSAIEVFLNCLRSVCGKSCKIVKKGSRAKKVDIIGSDFDYQIETCAQMTLSQREKILACLNRQGREVRCSKAFTVDRIDFFPSNAEWHPQGLALEPPGAVRFNNGARAAVRMMKQLVKKKGKELVIVSKSIEDTLFEIQREKGWNDKNDSCGMKRFSELQRRLLSGT